MTFHGCRSVTLGWRQPAWACCAGILSWFVLLAEPCPANPQGGQIVAGSANIDQTRALLTHITQHSDRAIIDWQSFSNAPTETIRFSQPSTLSVALNRVVGIDPSLLHGALQANGRIFLINPNGIVFGPTARVDVGGLVASTLHITNDDFMKGNYALAQEPGKALAAVINRGEIHVRDGGMVALVAPIIDNQGKIVAAVGRVGLAAGTRVVVNMDGHRLVNIALPDGLPGNVTLRVEEAVELIARVVNTTHVPEAGSVQVLEDGRVVLGGAEGLVLNEGEIRADGTPGRRAGSVEIEATRSVELAPGSSITASGTGEMSGGGTVRVESRGHARAHAGATLQARGSDDGDGGDVLVLAAQDTRFAGHIDARGGDRGGNGGSVEVSGKQHLSYEGTTDLRAAAGKAGTLTLDPTDIAIRAGGGPAASVVFQDGRFAENANSNASTLSPESLATQLGLSHVVVTTESNGSGAGDITIEDGFAWSSDFNLTLLADRHIGLNSGVVLRNTGGGSLALRADRQGLGSGPTGGTVTLGGAGVQIDWSGSSGAVTLFYNPANYANPVDYGGRVSMGTGVFTSYMLVNNLNQLQGMATNLAGTYALGQNIDATATATWNGGLGFEPVGKPENPFSGSFDGQNHKVSCLSIVRPEENNIGLFGAADGVAISAVRLVHARVSGSDRVGGLVGHSFNGSTIRNSSVTGVVSGLGSGGGPVGGLIGRADSGGTISDSYATAAVFGGSNVGGLVGWSGDSTLRPPPEARAKINNSYAIGTVSGHTGIGGLVGNTNGEINNSYATGTVTGVRYVGGLAGNVIKGAIVKESYATGSVSGGQTGVGGLIGLFGSRGGANGISNSYATGAVSGGSRVGGLVGDNDGEGATITNVYATGAVSGSSRVGGLFGRLNTAISNSYATGAVSGGDGVGGLVGSAAASVGGELITNSYATGAVSGADGVGGLVGEFNNSTSPPSGTGISNSYARGNVAGERRVGGLVGDFKGGTISRSYSTGLVQGTSDVGGFVGIVSSDSAVMFANFFDSQSTGLSSSQGVGSGDNTGVTGLETASLQKEPTFILAGWDFVSIWEVEESIAYPNLRWQSPPDTEGGGGGGDGPSGGGDPPCGNDPPGGDDPPGGGGGSGDGDPPVVGDAGTPANPSNLGQQVSEIAKNEGLNGVNIILNLLQTPGAGELPAGGAPATRGHTGGLITMPELEAEGGDPSIQGRAPGIDVRTGNTGREGVPARETAGGESRSGPTREDAPEETLQEDEPDGSNPTTRSRSRRRNAARDESGRESLEAGDPGPGIDGDPSRGT